MINQTSGSGTIGSDADGGSANPRLPPMLPEQAKNAPEGGSKLLEREPPARPSSRKHDRSPGARALETYIERRERLANRIKTEHPYYTDAEIEHRLEQFGA
jgi:hypothetical protein